LFGKARLLTWLDNQVTLAKGLSTGGVTFAALWAPGGMGKTSLQCEYCNAHLID
jgi:hypothetical protein